MNQKLLKVLFAFIGIFAFGAQINAQAPYESEDVMLQAFYWDSQNETSWPQLASRVDEFSTYFDMLWFPPSAKSSGVGYHPKQWCNQNSEWGSEEDLKDLIKKLAAKGCRSIADIVINHRGNKSSWSNFYEEDFGEYGRFQLNESHICRDDELRDESGKPDPTGDYDTGYESVCNAMGGYCAARDLDMKSSYVKSAIKAYLKWMRNEMGFHGWRYDLTKGYNGYYNYYFNEAAEGYYSVGEYWQDDYDALMNWVNDARKKSTTFDFTFKYAMNRGLGSGNNYSELVWNNNRPAGLIHSGTSRRYATTFVDNHDTYRNDNKFNGNIEKANAVMLASPGIPCVFYKHWQSNKPAIKAMIKARRACGIHSGSPVEANAWNDGYYSKARGKRASLICKLGDTSTPSGLKKVCGGSGWAYFVREDFDIESNIPEKEPIVEKLIVKATPVGGLYPTGTNVTLSYKGGLDPVEIYYTTDGTEPDENSNKYTSAIAITKKTDLKFVAIDSRGEKSDIVTENYLLETKTITLKFKAPDNWTACHLWAYDNANNNLTNAGEWPGSTAMIKGSDGYYQYTITDIEVENINFVFNNGVRGGEKTNDNTCSESSCWQFDGSTSPYDIVIDAACAPTGIDDNLYNDNFVVYPNPTADFINISGIEVANVSVFDMNAKLLIEANNSTKIDLSNIEKGIYILNITDTFNNVYNKKVVKY